MCSLAPTRQVEHHKFLADFSQECFPYSDDQVPNFIPKKVLIELFFVLLKTVFNFPRVLLSDIYRF
jgi:hypothetical protein